MRPAARNDESCLWCRQPIDACAGLKSLLLETPLLCPACSSRLEKVDRHTRIYGKPVWIVCRKNDESVRLLGRILQDQYPGAGQIFLDGLTDHQHRLSRHRLLFCDYRPLDAQDAAWQIFAGCRIRLFQPEDGMKKRYLAVSFLGMKRAELEAYALDRQCTGIWMLMNEDIPDASGWRRFLKRKRPFRFLRNHQSER